MTQTLLHRFNPERNERRFYRIEIGPCVGFACAIHRTWGRVGRRRSGVLIVPCEDLVRRGRARGLGITLVTQRAAVLNKDVLTQAEVMVALRTIAPQDRDAIDAWIRVHGSPEQREELMTSLPSLPVGTAWFWSPGWLDVFARVQVRRRETFDSSATPKVGQRPKAPGKLAEVDIEKLRERLAATIERAKADDPRELRRRIAELEKELRSRPTETKVEKVVERVEVPVIPDGQIEQLQQVIGRLAEIGEQLVSTAQDLGAALARSTAQPTIPYDEGSGTGFGPIKPGRVILMGDQGPVATHRLSPRPQPSPRKNSTAAGSTDPDVQLRAGERRMLDTLAQRYPGRVTRAQLATLSKFSVRGGTFSTYFGTLKRAGYIEETNGETQITQAGLDYLGHAAPPPPQSTEEILEMWRSALRAGERKMLDELVAIYPAALTREELGARTGITSSGGTFGTYLGMLRRNGLIDVAGDQVRASETLFLAG